MAAVMVAGLAGVACDNGEAAPGSGQTATGELTSIQSVLDSVEGEMAGDGAR